MDNQLKQTYLGKTILITGHTGFKGAWLSKWLNMLDAKVIGYALPPTDDDPDNLFSALNLPSSIHSHFGDITNYKALCAIINEYQPNVIFHMAAQALVRPSYQDPINTFSTNVMGTTHLLEAVRHCSSVKAVINVTTDKCYENKEWVWGYRETDRLGGRDPYSASKACAELVAIAYRKSFFADSNSAAIASVRAGNVIGGGDWSKDRLVPDIIQALQSKKPIIIRNPNALRPWQHVLDALYGYLLVGIALLQEGHQYADGWNFGPTDADLYNVESVANYALKCWGNGTLQIQPDKNAVHEAALLRLDSSKARAQLKWKPQWDTKTAIQMTMDWYNAYLNKNKSANAITEEQIKNYMNVLSDNN